jgi:hypothetical protein
MTVNLHRNDCDWHLDQYDWECTCGAVSGKLADHALKMFVAVAAERRTAYEARRHAWAESVGLPIRPLGRGHE